VRPHLALISVMHVRARGGRLAPAEQLLPGSEAMQAVQAQQVSGGTHLEW
jgi:hypothetical protein